QGLGGRAARRGVRGPARPLPVPEHGPGGGAGARDLQPPRRGRAADAVVPGSGCLSDPARLVARMSLPMKRGLAILAIGIGIGIAVIPFAMSLWSDAPAGQRIVERFDTTLSSDGLHDLNTNFATVGAMSTQVFG